MRAINLLPEKNRPRQATGGRQGSSVIVLGVLGAFVVAILFYVLSVNSINSSKTAIAEANAETARAGAQADALGAYGNFAKVKADRVAKVKQLAQGRTDWERVMRELAHVLPSGVWIVNADASDSGADSSDSSGASTTGTAATASTTTSSAAPQITLKGCASSQPKVAEALVRLRELQGASDVSLDHSTRPDDSSAGASSGSASGSGDCGTTAGAPNYDFQATVTLEAPSKAPDAPGKVPNSLGGGQ